MESIFFNPWIWIVAIILLILVSIAIILALYEIFSEDSNGYAWVPFGFLTVIILILSGFYFGALLPPYDASYYQTYRVIGEVETIESAFEGDEGTISQSFVLTINDVDYFIRSDDQRFRTINVGDTVRLSCNKVFQYFVDPWLECKFG